MKNLQGFVKIKIVLLIILYLPSASPALETIGRERNGIQNNWSSRDILSFKAIFKHDRAKQDMKK